MKLRKHFSKLLVAAVALGLAGTATTAVAGRGGSHATLKRAIATDNADTIARKLEQAEYLWSGAAINTVMALLDHQDYKVREAAAWWFSRRPAQAAEIHERSVALLQGGDAVLARNAADALGAFHHPRAIAALSASLDNGALDAEARGHVMRALGNIGHGDATAALSRGLADGDAFVRLEAVLAWSKIRGQQGAAPVAALVADGDAVVRKEAAAVVGRFREASARSALENALANDADPFVRRNAAYALGRIGDASSRSVLEAAVNDSSPLVRGYARAALRSIR